MYSTGYLSHGLFQPRLHQLRHLSGRAFSTTARRAKKQNSIPAAYYRGGTSRALIFHERDLPANRAEWAPIFLGAMGSPDPNGRQLDGMGGGISSLSKICVVAPSKRPDAQIDFTFVQVGVKNNAIDYAGNCGNMTSAIGPFAVDSGLVDPGTTSGLITVSLYNTNTDKIIKATFPVSEGEAVADGDFAIDGVSGTAARIQLDFIDPAGSKTGKLLPTGNTVDVFDGVRSTCVDVGNPCVFVKAEDLGVDGTMLPDETQACPGLLQRLESIRRQATVAMGIAKTLDDVPPSIPKICFVSRPSSSSSSHRLLSGEHADEASVDIVVRAISTGQPHRALPITAGLCVSAAAKLPGSVVHECLAGRAHGRDELLTIGHPSGKLLVGAKYDDGGRLERATVFRTARRLMVGRVYWK